LLVHRIYFLRLPILPPSAENDEIEMTGKYPFHPAAFFDRSLMFFN